MIDLVDYYEGALGTDILALSAACGGDFSIVAFANPTGPAAPPKMKRQYRAMSAERQVAFLLGYHFCVLLDQAIHEGVRPLHHRFEAVARYPKLRGILGSWRMNMHPALLLGVASAVVADEAIDRTTDEFRRLSNHVVTEYARYLVEDFADMTDTDRGDEARARLLTPVFSSLSAAYAILFRPSIPSTGFPFHENALSPRSDLWSDWCSIVQGDINRVGDGAGAWNR